VFASRLPPRCSGGGAGVRPVTKRNTVNYFQPLSIINSSSLHQRTVKHRRRDLNPKRPLLKTSRLVFRLFFLARWQVESLGFKKAFSYQSKFKFEERKVLTLLPLAKGGKHWNWTGLEWALPHSLAPFSEHKRPSKTSAAPRSCQRPGSGHDRVAI